VHVNDTLYYTARGRKVEDPRRSTGISPITKNGVFGCP